MLYGEVFADDIDPPCDNDPAQGSCVTGKVILLSKINENRIPKDY